MEMDSLPDAIAANIPLTTLVSKLTVPELRDLCDVHGIVDGRYMMRPVLLDKLTGHLCTIGCDQSILLIGRWYGDPLPPFVDLTDSGFLSTIQAWTPGQVQPLMDVISLFPLAHSFKVTRVCYENQPVDLDAGAVKVPVPFHTLIQHLTVPGLKSIAKAHKVSLRSTRKEAMD
jgi:hypothetical protein